MLDSDWFWVYVRLAIEPCRWLGEHVVIPMWWPVLMGCFIGVCWWKLGQRGE